MRTYRDILIGTTLTLLLAACGHSADGPTTFSNRQQPTARAATWVALATLPMPTPVAATDAPATPGVHEVTAAVAIAANSDLAPTVAITGTSADVIVQLDQVNNPLALTLSVAQTLTFSAPFGSAYWSIDYATRALALAALDERTWCARPLRPGQPQIKLTYDECNPSGPCPPQVELLITLAVK